MGHFRGQYLNDADNRLKSTFLANGGTAEMFKELKAQEPDSMKLIDLIYSKGMDLNKGQGAPSDDKEFEAYKIQTSKQIKELLDKEEASDNRLNSTINELNIEHRSKLKNTMITSKLNGKSFDSGMSKEDAIFLTMRKIEGSDFLLQLDDNGNERVVKKDNPEMDAVVDGKSVTWDYVLDKHSSDYTKKNEQTTTTQRRDVVVPASTVASDEEGRYIVGHKDYGKK